MTGKRISELAAITTPLSLQEIVPAVQSGTTTGISVEQLRGGRLVSIRDFGAIGDGSADDTAAFRAMHTRLRQDQQLDPELRSVIFLPPGHYRYTWNRWLWGLRHVTVHGYGARLQCVNRSKWNFNCYPLVTNRSGFQTVAVDDLDSEPHSGGFGFLIDSVAPGANAVTLKTTGGASSFSPGKYVLVMSYDQQFGGYPPNCRYFDYAAVTAVQGRTITLDRPLRHLHRDDYPEIGDDSCGRARIASMDSDDVPFAVKQTIVGITILPNPNLSEASVQYLLAQGVESFMARDCELVSFVPSIGRSFAIENSDVAYAEPDKLVDTVSFAQCRIGRLTQATGVNLLNVANCTLQHSANVQARTVSFHECHFHGAARPGDYQRGIDTLGFAPTKVLNVRGSTFFGKNGATDSVIAPVGMPPNAYTHIGLTPPAELGSDGKLIIPTTDKRAQDLLRNADPGDILFVGGEADGNLYCDGRFGMLTRIGADSAHVVFEISFTAPVDPKDIIIVPRTRRLVCIGNRYENIGLRAPIACEATVEDLVVGSQVFNLRARSDFAGRPWETRGFVRSLAVHVIKPYLGPDSGAFLRIEPHLPAKSRVNLAIDLRQVGLRDVSLHGALGIKTGDVVEALEPDRFVWSIRLSHGTNPTGPDMVPSGRGTQMAEYIVTVETSNPFRTGS